MGRDARTGRWSLALSLGTALALLAGLGASAADPVGLTLDARLSAQRALDQVHYEHHLWPEQNAEPKPPFELLYPEAERSAAVEEALRMGQALEARWQDPVTPDQIQAEMERMARDTQMPERLARYWSALGEDPEVVAEVLVRPLLTAQRIRGRYLWDPKLHGDRRAEVEAEISRARRLGGLSALTGARAEAEFVLEGGTGERPPGDLTAPEVFLVDRDRWVALERELLGPQVGSAVPALGPLVEQADYFEVTAVVARGEGRLRTLTWSWPKRPFESWWEEQRACFTEAVPPPASYRRPARPLHQLEGWSAMATPAAVDARRYHGAIWTGNQMVVWGGQSSTGTWLYTGGHYNPALDAWVATGTGSGCPAGRLMYRQAVWTGSYMVVWGNQSDASGGRYNVNTGAWMATTAINAPSARYDHSALWNGSYVVIWGGTYSNVPTKTGGRYEPGSNSWTTMNTASAPAARSNHAAAWDTTYGMVVWGGRYDASTGLNTGGQYTAGDGWPGTTNTVGAPAARELATALWRPGVHCIVWGGNTVSPAAALNSGGRWTGNAPGTWAATNLTGAPSARTLHTAVWSSTNAEMLVWGGYDYTNFLATGARYLAATDSWVALPTGTGAPSSRAGHSAVGADDVYTERMFVWGGGNASGLTKTGAAYHLCASGTSVPTLGAATSTASDVSTCAFSGVTVTWTKDPANWGDSGAGTRTYTVLRAGADLSGPIPYGTTTYLDDAGPQGTAYAYSVIYWNGCGHGVSTAGNSAADQGDTTPCPAVGDTLEVAKSGSDAALTWGAVTCADGAGYRVYGATSFSAAFPSGWTALTPDAPGASATDPLGSAYTAYRVVTLDTCLNTSVQ